MAGATARAVARRRYRAPRRGAARVACAVAVAIAPFAAFAEQRVNELWPELDVFHRIDERTRLFGFVSTARSREYASGTEASVGLNLDVFPESTRLGERWRAWFRAGYMRLQPLSGDGANENRLLADATLQSEPLVWGLRFADRNRFEWRDIGDDRSWRYRNRARVERTFVPGGLLGDGVGDAVRTLGIAQATPYAMLELFYDGRASDWTRRVMQAGVEFDLRQDRGVEVYLARQDDLRTTSSTVIAVGVVLVLRF